MIAARLTSLCFVLLLAACEQNPQAPQADDTPPTRAEIEEAVQRGFDAMYMTQINKETYHYTVLHTEVSGHDMGAPQHQALADGGIQTVWPIRMTVTVRAERYDREPEVKVWGEGANTMWLFFRDPFGKWIYKISV